tara:strand:+ start:3303 stop:3800 length:498 start_codon:yes stop_codon:yes gene_type:complete
MQITQQELYKIILEEYAREEGLEEALSPEKVAELLAWIRGEGPRPEWANDELGTSGVGKGMQAPADADVDRSADTMPFSSLDEPSPEQPKSVEDKIAAMVKDMPPEEVADLFQSIFEKIPGVEMGDADEEPPETLYRPGAEGRPKVGFKLEELKALIRQVLSESV